jgi:hypothetical protein
MISNQVHRGCPNCGSNVLCDEHDCGCIFGKCENCNTDFEFDDNCKERERERERWKTMDKQQLKNWRAMLVGLLGPFAFLLRDKDVAAVGNITQGNADANKKEKETEQPDDPTDSE